MGRPRSGGHGGGGERLCGEGQEASQELQGVGRFHRVGQARQGVPQDRSSRRSSQAPRHAPPSLDGAHGSHQIKLHHAKRFAGIDAQVRSILKKCHEIKNVRKACTQSGLLAKLEALQLDQEICKKSLADFLDGKRRLFPRFYFTSEADLLDILFRAQLNTYTSTY